MLKVPQNPNFPLHLSPTKPANQSDPLFCLLSLVLDQSQSWLTIQLQHSLRAQLSLCPSQATTVYHVGQVPPTPPLLPSPLHISLNDKSQNSFGVDFKSFLFGFCVGTNPYANFFSVPVSNLIINPQCFFRD